MCDANDLVGDVANANPSTAVQSSLATTSLLPGPLRQGIKLATTSLCKWLI